MPVYMPQVPRRINDIPNKLFEGFGFCIENGRRLVILINWYISLFDITEKKGEGENGGRKKKKTHKKNEIDIHTRKSPIYFPIPESCCLCGWWDISFVLEG